MPRKKGKKRRKKSEEKEQKKRKLDLHPDVMKGVWGIFFVVSSVFLGISFAGGGGVVGESVLDVLRWLLGGGVYITPVVFIILAIVFFRSWHRNVYFSSFIGVALFFASLLGLLALTNGEHIRGGALGLVVTWPLLKFVGLWGSVLILVGLLTASIFVTLNIPPSRLLASYRKQDSDEEESEDDEEVHVRTFSGDEEPLVLKDKRHNEKEEPQERKETRKNDEEEFVVSPRRKGGAEFHLPSIDLLEKETGKPDSGDIVSSANIIKRTLQNFSIDVEMGEVNVGPTVTQFTLKPAEGVKLARIIGLHNDLSLALAAHPIRIEAPIPGRSLVGIEVPNRSIATVRLRNLLDSDGYKKAVHPLTLALGRDVSGAPVYANLAKMPHILVAGSTGAGKTIALNSLILSLLYRNPPDLMRLILIDPKRVEFPVYAGIPHLLAPIIVDSQKAINALRWAVGEMERRFEVLAAAGKRDIQSYNADKAIVEKDGYLPYNILVIDELADIMSSRGKEAEALIVRIAQMARAVGIHLVLATQRPSVEVITGLIKANITARMAFQVASQVDSRTVLDGAGAEKLLGNGDMLYLAPEASKPRRIQGAFISEQEPRKVADFLRKEGERLGELVVPQEDFGSEQTREVSFDNPPEGAESDTNSIDDDELYESARRVVVEAQRASATLLQRRLRVGYARAARIIDMLEERGVIGPGEGAKPREVYERLEDNIDNA